MPTRTFSATNAYRYGFNGKENDNEIKGEGNQQDYGFRIYDPRVGRFLSTDPLTQEYPWYTPYQFGGNNPIEFIDRDGLEPAKKGVINAATEDQVATSPIASGIQNGLFNVASAFGLNLIDDLTADLADAIKGNQTWSQAGGGMIKSLEDVKNNIPRSPVSLVGGGMPRLAPVVVADGQTLVVTQRAIAAPIVSNPNAVIVLTQATKAPSAANKKGGVEPNNKGKTGGKRGGEDASKTPYVGPVSGKNRLSDINTPGKVLGEIKNNLNYVQWLSTQIKDGLAEAFKNGQEYILKMANPDKVTKPLKEAIKSQGGKGAKITNLDAPH